VFAGALGVRRLTVLGDVTVNGTLSSPKYTAVSLVRLFP
jgi:hypothetical protein